MTQSLQDLIDQSGNAVDLLRNSTIGAYTYPVVPPEFSNWRREMRAWREGVVLFDQSHHMLTMFVNGPDALKLISDTAVNSVANFPVNTAKQYVPVSPDGYVIGDAILFRMAEDSFILIGRSTGPNWLEYNAKLGNYDVVIERDERSPARTFGKAVTRKHWRYQIQGPNAWKLIEKLNGGPYEQTKFFTIGEMKIAGTPAWTLRHGMAGAPGLELWGPYENYDLVRETILAAGEEFDLEQCGSRTYAPATFESGWIPSPLPAVYAGDSMRPYREYLPAQGFEGLNSLAGSFVSKNVEDYFLTPWDLGYGGFVKFDHDFIGRDALEKIDPSAQRRKVTLAFNSDDLTKIYASQFTDDPFLGFEQPLANYGAWQYDTVLDQNDNQVGFSLYAGYSENEQIGLSLGSVSPEVKLGDEVRVIWGEPDGGSKKTTIMPHRQTEIRARIAPVPISTAARGEYHQGWRTTAV
ncbi:MAG TPA: aminomethyl transferase family protein [Pseudolysinimonas sp.]|nr:aminomethyl transferase family protein [Pseudolysinimonas sp.]